MSGRVIVECPECLAKLSLSDEIDPGKRVRCPKCKEAFVAIATESEHADTREPPASSTVRKGEAKKSHREPESRNRSREDRSQPAYETAGARTLPPRTGSRRRLNSESAQNRSSLSAGDSTFMIAGVTMAIVILVGAGIYFFGFRNRSETPSIASAPAETVASQSVVPATNAALNTNQNTDPNPTSVSLSPQQPPPQLPALPQPAPQQESTFPQPVVPQGTATAGLAPPPIQTSQDNGVAASNSAEWPEGVELLTGSTRWYWMKGLRPDGQRVEVMELIINMKGDMLSRAVAYGHVNLKTLSLGPNQNVVLYQDFFKTAGSPNPMLQFEPYRPQGSEGTIDYTPGNLRIFVPFVAPASSASTLALVEGQFRIRVGKVHDIVIPDLRAAIRNRRTDPALAAVNAKVAMWKADYQGRKVDIFEFRIDPKTSVGPLIIKAEGQVSPYFDQGIEMRPNLESDPSGNTFSTRHTPHVPDSQLSLAFQLYSDLQEITVPFRFENIPLPDISLKPKK